MYQVLARKYRPRNFSQLVGQTHVSRALTSALERGRLHHAYLFTGTRGVGKTTIARILAKCLNCETGVTATPCEVCTVCQAVNEGRFIDLIEIDAASRTRVEDTRDLLDNVPYAPTQGRYKVYLIDEVHMLSTHSFNALLKTLEEPPEHVKFLFATTDPQKLPITVISRCLQFTLRPLAKDEIFTHLNQILDQEQIKHQDAAIWQLAESAQGSLRDALSLTDQAIAYGQGQVATQDVTEMLGLIDKNLIFDLMCAIHQNQLQVVAQILQEMRQQAIDVNHVLEQLITMLHEVAVQQCLGHSATSEHHLETQLVEQQKQQQLAQLIAPQDLQLYYQIAIQGRADLGLALTPEQGFEMCLMRLLAFRPMNTFEVMDIDHQVPSSTQQSEPHQATASLPNLQSSEPHPDESEHQDHLVTFEPSSEIQTPPDHTDDLSNHIEPDEVAPHEHVTSQPSVMPHMSESIQNDLITPDEPQLFDDEHSVEHDKLDQTSIISEKPDQSDQDDIESQENQIEHIQPDQNIKDTQPISDIDAVDVQQTEQLPTTHEQDILNDVDSIDDPRTLLLPKAQDLTGQWTLEKWDYWLRQSSLSPMQKEYAQHGVMQGDISGTSILTLDPSYQKTFESVSEAIEAQLKTLNENLSLHVNYQATEDTTPFQLQQERKIVAYQQAEQKILQHKVIQEITTQFSAQVEELKFKD